MSNGWIDCKERMPDVGVYLVCVQETIYGEQDGLYVYPAERWPDKWTCYGQPGLEFRSVTHWQPLPLPPEVKK